MHEDCHIDYRKLCTLDIGKAWQWAAASGNTRHFRILKGSPGHGGVGADTWHQRHSTLWSWLMKRSFISAQGASSRLCPHRLQDTIPKLLLDLLQGILRLLTSLLDCDSDLLWVFFISWPDPCRSLKQQPGTTRGRPGVESDALHGTRTL